MSAYDVEPGDVVHPGDPVIVDRYTAGARINHWITATCLVLLALSGLALFHPSLFFLTALFGGGQTDARHPSRGSASCCSSASPACSCGSGRRICGRARTAPGWRACAMCWPATRERLPEVGKYNAGQKIVFWAMSILIIVLIVSGMVIWDQYFSQYTTHRAEADRRAGPRRRGGRRSSASGSSTFTRRSGCAARSGR